MLREFNKPVRKIGFQYRSISGVQKNLHNGTVVEFESSLERDLITILNFDYCVEQFIQQPVEIRYINEEGRERSYTPDFLVQYREELNHGFPPTLFEVKYRKDLFENWKILKPKLKAGLSYAKEKGWRFKIITEKEIRNDFLFNAKFLWPYKLSGLKSDYNIHHKYLILSYVYEFSLTTPKEIMIAIAKSRQMQGEILYTLWCLIASGEIGCNLNLKLNMDTEIWSIT